jgi:hypothetical protein
VKRSSPSENLSTQNETKTTQRRVKPRAFNRRRAGPDVGEALASLNESLSAATSPVPIPEEIRNRIEDGLFAQIARTENSAWRATVDLTDKAVGEDDAVDVVRIEEVTPGLVRPNVLELVLTQGNLTDLNALAAVIDRIREQYARVRPIEPDTQFRSRVNVDRELARFDDDPHDQSGPPRNLVR